MVEIEAPVVRVELFEDRAAVTRRIALDAPGRHHLRVGPLSPLVSAEAISFPGGARATLEEVRVERVRTTRKSADPEEIRALEAEWRTASDALDAASDAYQRAAEHHARTAATLSAVAAASSRALGEQDPERWIDLLDRLVTAVSEARAGQTAARTAHARRKQEADALHHRLESGRAARPVVHGFFELSVLADEAGDLLLRYVVPCAVWRPAHRAELQTGTDGRVSWELTAVCWNATGEDWTDVALVCSTARPGDLASPPALVDDVIETRRRDNEIVVEARDVTIEVARESGARAQARAPGVDDGGEPRTFLAVGPVVLPSTGRPVTVVLDRWEAAGTSRWLALPERAGAAVLRSVQRNAGTRPLLAGPVELVRDGVAIGRGRVGLVPPGDPFPLGWGSHDGIRISRRREHELNRGLITGRTTHRHQVEIRVVNLGHERCPLEVRERIPTSELKEITVSAPRATPELDTRVDPDGFCRWTLDLAPGETRVLKLEYTVDAASNVRLPPI